MSYRAPLMVEKFSAETNAQKIIQDRITNIHLAIEAKDKDYLEACLESIESALMAEGITDVDYVKKLIKIKERAKDDYDEALAKYESECNGALCSDVIEKPSKSSSYELLLERFTLVIEFCQSKGIYLRKKNKFHHQ